MRILDQTYPPAIWLMTVSEACRRLGICRSTFYNLVAEGKVPLRKVGGSSRVRSDELEAFIERLPALREEPVTVAISGGDA